MTQRARVRLRVVASMLSLLSYYLLVYGNTWVGCVIAIVSQLMFMPWTIKARAWDMTALDSFHLLIAFSRLVTL